MKPEGDLPNPKGLSEVAEIHLGDTVMTSRVRVAGVDILGVSKIEFCADAAGGDKMNQVVITLNNWAINKSARNQR